jgi:lysine 2,3-aminomutase
MAGYLEELGKTKKAKVNPYLEALLKELGETYGCGSRQYNGIYNQFFKMPDFDAPSFMVNDRHYHAEAEGNGIPKGVERLYKRHLVIDLTQSCAAECSYCLRGNYGHFTLNRESIGSNFGLFGSLCCYTVKITSAIRRRK